MLLIICVIIIIISTVQIGVQLFSEFLERVIPDYYMIPSQHFSDKEKNGDDDKVTEAIWCQSSNDVIGTWYYPNNTQVVLFTETTIDGVNTFSGPGPIFSASFIGQIGLLRDRDSETPLTSGFEGLYKCIIDGKTLVVGVYDTSTYNDNSELMISCVVIIIIIIYHFIL